MPRSSTKTGPSDRPQCETRMRSYWAQALTLSGATLSYERPSPLTDMNGALNPPGGIAGLHTEGRIDLRFYGGTLSFRVRPNRILGMRATPCTINGRAARP